MKKPTPDFMTKKHDTTPDSFKLKFDAWLIKTTQPDAKPEEVKMVAQHQMGLQFLIAWSLFERKYFTCDANGKTIKAFAKKQCVQKCFPEIEAHWNHFYARYSHKEKGTDYIAALFPDIGERGAKNKKDAEKFREDLESLAKKPSEANKTELMARVIFRYRNNIFHGVKTPYTWGNYEKQIKRCIRTIMIWVDGYSEEV
jgi:hypothetical protein